MRSSNPTHSIRRRLRDLQAFGSERGTVDAVSALRIVIQTSAVTTNTAVAGITNASTVTDVVNAINTQFGAYVTASFDSADRVRVQANAVGAAVLGVYDNFGAILSPTVQLGVADAVFRGVAAPVTGPSTTALLPASPTRPATARRR